MKKCCVLFLLLLLAFSNSLLAAPLDVRLEEFRQFLQDYRKKEKLPSFSVAVVKDGEIVLAEGIGWQD
ncbi:MAG: hypothetical protein AAFN50_14230, partial [Pseudomonadota bacterium]